ASIELASRGILPDWAVATAGRRAHMARVAELMDEWAGHLGLPAAERVRWRAAAWLHDALRDADPEGLRETLPERYRQLPDPVLHGPAVAVRLEAEGVDDPALLAAVAWHTLGSATLDRMGRALYLADFLEPGRSFAPVWRAALSARMPEAMDAILREVAAARLEHAVRAGRPLHPETVGFWNALTNENWS